MNVVIKVNDEIMEKYSYAQYYEPFHWIVATGETIEEAYAYSGEINVRSFRLIFTLMIVFIALFIVIFVEQWFEKKNRFPAIVGVVASVICLLIFGKDSFILPSMIVIMTILLSNHRIEEKKNKTEEVECDE